MSKEFAKLPRVDDLLEHDALGDLGVRRNILRDLLRERLDEARESIRAGGTAASAESIAASVCERVRRWSRPAPRRVINATGVLLHTNLGRAPLSSLAVEHMVEAAGVCDLEYDLNTGVRGSRFDAMGDLLRCVLSVPDAHVFNNGAAALMIACRALGYRAGGDSSVIIGRSQMVEIGDGFRVASMVESGGCTVHEVGATNRVHLADYEAALDAGAAAILWVHASNFELQGFVAQPSLADLAELARARKVPLIADLGSGSLGGEALAGEPTVRDYLDGGASVVTFSGDKLLGGPQAGILAGEAELVHRCRRHPMARALRPDKTSLAALRATLYQHALAGESPLPLHRMLAHSVESLRERAQSVLEQLSGAGIGTQWSVRESTATVGGGSLPGDARPSVALVYAGGDARRVAKALRLHSPAVVGRMHEGELWLDFRSLRTGEDTELTACLHARFGE